MAKKARMANINTMRGINIFKDGIPGAAEAEEAQSPAPSDTDIPEERARPSDPGQSETPVPPAPMPESNSVKDEKKTLRSYHLSEAVINKLEDAYMVYSLKKIDKSKQDIVAEALEKHFAELEQQGFFHVLELLRN